MLKVGLVRLGLSVCVGAFLLCMTMVGCGDDTTEKVERSPAALKADQAGRDAMKEFMQSKTPKAAHKK